MREKLIENLIQVEKDARLLEEEGHKEARNLRDEYKKKMESEKKERLETIREKGKKIVEEAEKEAVKYQKQIEDDLENELAKMEDRYTVIKEELLKTFLNKIVKIEGE